VLKDDLFTMRRVIDEYAYDKKHSPRSLDELVQAGYLKRIPHDPMTGKADWLVDQEDPSKGVDPNRTGIANVRSRSNLVSCDGTTYSTW
jgi:general secretion pathway protein G